MITKNLRSSLRLSFFPRPIFPRLTFPRSFGISACFATFISLTATLTHAQVNVWGQTGEDKVSRDELRMTQGRNVTSSVWDGTTLKLFGAKDEVVNANIVIEAPSAAVGGLSVSLNALTGPGGAVIGTKPVSGNGIFDWTGRNIELFYVRYLQVQGLTTNGFEHYDERHIPLRFERPWSGQGNGQGSWTSRPDHDKYYPDIAIPLELVPTFSVAAGQNQSIWVDIYIPKTAAAGVYSGTIAVTQSGSVVKSMPVQLTVRNFALPDVPSSKTMVYYTPSDLNTRYFGAANAYINPRDGTPMSTKSILIRNRHFQMAHRHKLALVDDNYDVNDDQPSPYEWTARLDGSLFTPSQGYDGPGVSQGNGVFSIGMYGTWSWKNGTETDMWNHTNAWESWFQANSPSTERSLYLVDEVHDATEQAQVETWAEWMKSNPGPGSQLKSYATIDLPTAAQSLPALDIDGATLFVGDQIPWQNGANVFTSGRREVYLYNGHRPASGSFAIEDEGSSLRELPWGQYKKKISRWYMWESTYYNNSNFKGYGNIDPLDTNVFENAHTFGTYNQDDGVLGRNGNGYSNGDGVLFYPGTDALYAQDSYGIDGPFASLRLKFWRRGVQDVDYLTLASAIDPTHTNAIVNRMAPKVLWENGVADENDPSYQLCPISWSINPDDWEAARAELAQIIESNGSPFTPTPVPTATSPVPTARPTATTLPQATATLSPTTRTTAVATATTAATVVPTKTPSESAATKTPTAATPAKTATPMHTVAATSAPGSAPTAVPTLSAQSALTGTISGQVVLRLRSSRSNLAAKKQATLASGSVTAVNAAHVKYTTHFTRGLHFVVNVPSNGRYTIKVNLPRTVSSAATYRLVFKSSPASVKAVH